MVAVCNRADHFCPVISIFFLFSSPNLSGRRLDVYRTSTHGVASANLECRSAARGSLNTQDAKLRHLRTIARIFRAISSQLRHVLTIDKNC